MIPDEARDRATLTVEEAAEILGIGRSAAYAAVRRDEIPSLRLGRRVLVPTAPLLRLLGLEDEIPGGTSAEEPDADESERPPTGLYADDPDAPPPDSASGGA